MTRVDRTLRRAAGAVAVGLGGVQLASLEDPRSKRGRKWPVATLVRTILVGLLSGTRSLKETERLSNDLGCAMRRKLRITRRVPDTTMRELVMRLPLGSVLPLLHGQIRAAGRKKQLAPVGLPCGVLAIDGKCATTDIDDGVYAQRQGDGRFSVRTMTCSLVSAAGAPVIHLTPVPHETNEMGVFQSVLREVVAAYGSGELFGLVSGDAGMTGKENAGFIHHELKLGYLLALKANQPNLFDEAMHLLGELPRALAQARTRERLGSKRHIRRVWLACADDGVNEWDHARTFVRVQYEIKTTDGEVLSTFDRYFISNEKPGRFTPDQWLAVVRMHWRVENDNHKTLDVVLGEDDHPWIRDPRGMLVLQVLRRIACNALNALRLITLKPKTATGVRPRLTEWSRLLGSLRRALLAALEHHLEGLRWPPEIAAALP